MYVPIFFLGPLQVWKSHNKLSLGQGLLFSRLNNPSSLSFSPWEGLHPSNHLHSLSLDSLKKIHVLPVLGMPRRSSFTAGGSSELKGVHMTPYTAHPRSQTSVPYRLDPRFPTAQSQISHSIKQFNHSAVTQKKSKLVPPRKQRTQTKDPQSFVSSQSKSAKVLALPPESLPFVVIWSVPSPGWATAPWPLCYAKNWLLMAS